MIQNLKPYPAYKDSGLSWLGQLPEHWAVRRQRNAIDMRVSSVDKHSKEGEQPVRLCNYVDVYKNDRITEKLSFMHATATREEVERFRLMVGDVLITKDSESWNDIGIPALVEHSAPDLVCGYHLALLRPRDGQLRGSYLLRTLQVPAVASQYHVSANGVTRYGLSHDAIKSVLIPVPPLHEQSAIVRFLDYADRRIRRYIRAKKKLISLLNEQKQAIIHRAVTRGINPHIRLKPSGVEWLGDVPEHWEVTQIRSVARIVRGGSPRPAGSPLYFHGAGEPWITVGELTKDSNMHLLSTSTRLTALGAERSRIIRSGTLLLTNSGATLGVPKISLIQGCINDGVAAFLNLRQKLSREFLYFYLSTQTAHLKAWVDLGAQPNLNTQIIGGWPVLLPPVDEQASIVDHVKRETALLVRALDKAAQEISLIQGYRTRLIADVVTGKLDVREAAAQLPDEAEELEPLDETEALAEGDEPGDDTDVALEEAEA